MKELIALLQQTNTGIYDYLKKHHCADWETDGSNYFYQNNHAPLLLVAHMDTVTIKKTPNIILSRNVMTNGNNEPLGADDRAGVWAMLRITQLCRERGVPLPSMLITDGEERGGAGVKAFLSDDLKGWKEGVRLMVELDRKGANEWVDYLDVDKKVKAYVESFGYVSSLGSYSDIMDLTYDTLIPGVNLSVGYYSQHTSLERLHIDELYLTCERVVRMCKDPIAALYPCEEPRSVGRGGYGGYGRGGYNYGDGYGDWDYDYRYDSRTNRYVQTATKKETKKQIEDKTSTTTQLYMLDEADLLIEEATIGGKCLDCGTLWTDCECGNMEYLIMHGAYDGKFSFEWFNHNYLTADDKLYPALKDWEDWEDSGQLETADGWAEVCRDRGFEEEEEEEEREVAH
jgi:hypothetical protein